MPPPGVHAVPSGHNSAFPMSATGTPTIRAGTDDDDAVCGHIIAAATMASLLPQRLPHALEKWRDSSPLPRDGRTRLVAELAGSAQGFADYSPGRGHLRYLFVAPDAQGHGLGSALLDRVQAELQASMTVHCLAVNDISLRWYIRHGFAIVDGFLEELEGEDAVWIRLRRDPRVNREPVSRACN